MAFPDNVTNFTRAEDPTTVVDMNNIAEYQRRLADGDFSGAATWLQSMAKGIEMNLNASRFNEVLDVINQIEEFYLGLNGVKQYINDNINAFSDVALYNNTTNYSIGNLASGLLLSNPNVSHPPTGCAHDHIILSISIFTGLPSNVIAVPVIPFSLYAVFPVIVLLFAIPAEPNDVPIDIFCPTINASAEASFIIILFVLVSPINALASSE